LKPVTQKRENMIMVYRTLCQLFDMIEKQVPIEDIIEWLGRDANNVVLKQEVYNSYDPKKEETLEDYESFKNKCRHFFIPYCFTGFASQLIGKIRHGLERGRAIRVGMSWWHGGAYQLACYLHYDTPGQVFSSGDFTKQDKHIPRDLLHLYMAQLKYYVRSSSDSVHDQMFKILLQFCNESIANKITHMIGDMWVVMEGVMPSGTADTSHGDSWIVAFLFSLLIAKACSTSWCGPIMRYVDEGRIRIVTYGDDHIISVPDDVYHLVGSHAFAELCETFGMPIRDLHKAPFLSTFDHNGEVVDNGVVFLQRHFISKEDICDMVDETLFEIMPPILPCRPAYKNITKFGRGTNTQRGSLDLILSCIGHAYDTMGTNLYAYRFLHKIYKCLVREAGYTVEDMSRYVQYHLGTIEGLHRHDVTKVFKKLQLSEKDICNFPSLRNLHERLSGEPESFTKEFEDVMYDMC